MNTNDNKVKDTITQYIVDRIESLIEDLDTNEVRDDIIDRLWATGIELERDYRIKSDNTTYNHNITTAAEYLADKLAAEYINNRIETKQ
jgi:hypothetical protein